MKFLSVVSVVSLVATVVAQSLEINTPTNAVVCQPVLLTWSEGTPPYYLTVVPGGQPSAPPIEDLGQVNGDSFTWTVNVAPGTSVGLTLRDSTGSIAESAAFVVQNGESTSCLNST